jgi:hypothetical protein
MSDRERGFNNVEPEQQSNQSRINDGGGPDPAKDGPAEEVSSMLIKNDESHKCTDRRTGIKTQDDHYSWRQVYNLLAVEGGHDV